MTLNYSLDNTATLAAATVVEKFTLPTGDPGFTVKAMRIKVTGGAFGGTTGNGIAVNLKKGSSVLATQDIAVDAADKTAYYVDVSATSSLSPYFKAGDTFELSTAETGTAVKSAGGITIDVICEPAM